MKKTNITLSIALAAVFSATTAFAEAEVTGKFTYERAQYNKNGSTIGDFGTSTADSSFMGSGGRTGVNTPTNGYYGMTTNTATPSHGSDVFKSEVKAQIFIDGEVNSDSTYHVELQGYSNSKNTSGHDSNTSYTQRDALREAYIDTEYKDWSIRAGKQQVVWGTADGMKLLDTINPTDYSEMAQNQMEDSRITTWMLNAEKDLEDGGSVQVVISQPKENVFAGLNRGVSTTVRENGTTNSVSQTDPVLDNTLNNGTDTGNAFMMMGPDSITGVRNGFLNITPDLGSVASRFAMAFTQDGTDGAAVGTQVAATGTVTGTGDVFNGGLVSQGNLDGASMEGFIVGDSTKGFAKMTMGEMNGGMDMQAGTVAVLSTGATPLTSAQITEGNFFSDIPEAFERAIYSVAKGIATQANGGTPIEPSMDQMSAVTGAQMLDMGFAPLYNTNLSSFSDGNKDSAFEYMTNTTFRTFNTFVNAKSQYVYAMPKDSDIDLAARFKNSKDGVNYSVNASYNYDKNPIIDLSWRGDSGQKLETHQYTNALTGGNTSLQLYDSSKVTSAELAAATTTAISAADANAIYGGTSNKAATLQFSQEVKRVKQIGGSFDTAIETAALGPVVIRGEALYTKDGYSPVMDKDKLAIGDLVGALQMVKADRFKFVLGADITALTNMMISAQFIQDSNLDFVDNGNNYTTDYATMHLSNGFNKGIKDKNFYSLFFSKPFGASGEHRWNNITMLEEGVNGNGKWNRLDAEFSINDDTQATVEYNKYWGNENTQFGQLKASSNIQVGVKYSF